MTIAVHIVPNASRDTITGRNDSGEYRIKIQSPPVDGAANKGLIKFLAKTCGVARSHIHIVRGETSRHKIIEIDGNDADIAHILESAVS